MVFHILNFSQCVCFGIKRSTKLQISKSTHFFFFLSKNYNKRLVWTTKLCSCICDITKIIPPTKIWMVSGWGECLVEHSTFQNRNPVWVFFISLYFWWKPTVFRKCWMSFSSLWDYGIYKFNVITVSLQLMLQLNNYKYNTYYPCTYLYTVN